MTAAATCPAAQELRLFAVGKLPAQASAAVEAHLTGCARCQSALAAAPLGDTLADAVRVGVTLLSPDERSAADALASRVKAAGLARAEDATIDLEAADGTDPTVLLGPPEAPGEIGTLAGYRVLKVLGRGGMGVVFLAHDAKLGRPVALKLMRPDLARNASSRQRFQREARATAAVKDDHIVTIHQVDEAGGVPFLAMELLDGEPLDAWLERVGPTAPLADVLRIGHGVARGLQAAHRRGLIHRDIKPANLWQEPSGRVKLLDFGLARGAADDTNLTQSGAILGTPSYMSPEQARGEPVDARADLYSLGAVLYKLCTGRAPFTGPNITSVLMALATEQPRPPREVNPAVPEGLSALILRLLAKDRGGRPDTAAAVAETLEAMQRAGFPAPPKRPARPRWPWAAAAAAALLAGVMVLTLPGTDGGTVSIEAADDDVEVLVKQGGKVVEVLDRKGKQKATLRAGTYEVELKNDAGTFTLDAPGFTLKRGGVEVVRVTCKGGTGKPAGGEKVAPQGGGDRKAAEWALSAGGRVQVDGKPEEIGKKADLPAEPFRLTGALFSAAPVDDDGLARLKDCQNLTDLHMWEAAVTDAGLAQLKGCKSLTRLTVRNASVTDAGLAHLKELKGLKFLRFWSCPKVTEAGLLHLKGIKGLEQLFLIDMPISDAGVAHLGTIDSLSLLSLSATKVTDAGLIHLECLKNLTALHLANSNGEITDAGLARIKVLKNLTDLDLRGLRITDAGLAHLAGLKLGHLLLDDTGVGDAGLAHLEGMKALQRLEVGGTGVGDASVELLAGLPALTELQCEGARISKRGHERLLAARPGLKVTWSEMNREVATRVLALGGSVSIGEPGKEAWAVKAAADLPDDYFQVRRISLAAKKPVDDLLHRIASLNFPTFDRLEALSLSGVPFADTRLFPRMASLREFALTDCSVSDGVLVWLPALPGLERLSLDGNPIRGPGLERLELLPKLEELSLARTELLEPHVPKLAALKKLKRLSLAGSPVTDDGVRPLKALEKLEALDLRGTKVTAKGIDELRKALPKCKVEWAAADEK